MQIKNPTRYSAKLKEDVEFISRKLRKLSYLIPDEADELINVLTELQNYTEDICCVLISKESKES